MNKKAVRSIYEVAREAGVSTATVSRALGNRPDLVAPATRERQGAAAAARSSIPGRSVTDPNTPSGDAKAASPETLQGRELSVSLTVKDLERSTAWYRDVLGVTIDRRHEREGQLFAVSLRAGAVRLLLARDNGAKGLDRTKGDGFSMQITTAQDIDAIANRVKASGTVLETEPADAWGARVFRVRDPDGFLLVISSIRQ